MGKHTPEQMNFHPRLSGSENHHGFVMRIGDNLVGEFYPLDEDGIKGKAVAQVVADRFNALANIPDPAAYLKERADYIARLEAVVRAGDGIRNLSRPASLLRPDELRARNAYDAARARVNLAELQDGSVNKEGNSDGEA